MDHLVRARAGTYICERCVAQAQGALTAAAPGDKVLRIRPPSARVGDRDEAEQAVERAFETMLDAGLPIEARCAVLEDGASLAGTMRELEDRYPPSRGVEVVVDAVRFVAHDEAEVRFTIRLSPLSRSGLDRVGYAIRIDDTWKVTRHTWCPLVSMAGVHCPPRSTD